MKISVLIASLLSIVHCIYYYINSEQYYYCLVHDALDVHFYVG